MTGVGEARRERLLAQARELPDAPGVYLMRGGDGGEIYVGKAKRLRRRVASYFQKRERRYKDLALAEKIADFEYVETDSELEAFLLESRLIKDLQPRYNVMLKNTDRYPFIEVTWGEDFPRVITAWRKENPDSRYFGPFVGAGDIRGAISMLQRIFRFRSCRFDIRGEVGDRFRRRGCLNYSIKRCSGPCFGKIGREEYRRRIAGLSRFLCGQKRDLVEDLRRDMDAAAKELRFEEAAELRDIVHSLATINRHPDIDESLAPFNPGTDPEKGLEALRTALDLKSPPRRIEGIDIANLMGGEVVGSLVSFLDGMPFKDGYRRYRIRTVEGQDDFACVAEVVRRRYGRMAAEGAELPDIILIDGGRGQLGSAETALRDVGIFPAALMSLAKAEETPFLAGRADPVPLSRRNAGLKILMHVRDESHRFAQHYHHILRRKAMFGEK
ncbi:MAG: excinuclease ABC subunit UvrC [Planctomycetota bacterium]|jgi:excinuclease ABC subunit C|nr:excinuclease ABC subunit UvrC [Planctomycetota bacterium]